MITTGRAFVVCGAGGHGRMVGDLIEARGEKIVAYADRNPAKLGSWVEDLGVMITHLEPEMIRVIQETGAYPESANAFALGIGDNHARQECLIGLGSFEVPSLVHPSAMVSPSARLGRGCVVFPLAVVNAGARVGAAVIVNSGAIIEHDCELMNAVHVSPGAVLCGGVRVGERTWIGAGATVIHQVRIGNDVVVGAGSTVIEDVMDGITVVGSPARQVNPRRDNDLCP